MRVEIKFLIAENETTMDPIWQDENVSEIIFSLCGVV